MYTLQSQYLARNPINLSLIFATFTTAIGLGGYALFRSVNAQKDRVRLSHGNCNIWGKKAEVMYCHFKTADGNTHETLLLLSGEAPHNIPCS
jgi:7-dehydrocholesterol reductase